MNVMAKKIVLLASGFWGAFGTAVAFAQTSITLTNPIGTNNFNDVVTKVANFLQIIALPIAVIMVLIGAFQMMTSAGDPEKFSKGRNTILYAAIGVFVVLIAGGIVSIIQSLFK